MKRVYLGLGSNLGKREDNLQAALNQLQAADVHILRVSSLYETEPVGLREQRWFMNLVVEAETSLFPMQLLARIGKIERMLGRQRTTPGGPRTIDIDILFYGSFVIRTTALEVPHPRLTGRRFVLEPLAELAPDLRHPVNRKTVRELLAAVAGQSVRKAGSLGSGC